MFSVQQKIKVIAVICMLSNFVAASDIQLLKKYSSYLPLRSATGPRFQSYIKNRLLPKKAERVFKEFTSIDKYIKFSVDEIDLLMLKSKKYDKFDFILIVNNHTKNVLFMEANYVEPKENILYGDVVLFFLTGNKSILCWQPPFSEAYLSTIEDLTKNQGDFEKSFKGISLSENLGCKTFKPFCVSQDGQQEDSYVINIHNQSLVIDGCSYYFFK